jgi:hypothetical protein
MQRNQVPLKAVAFVKKREMLPEHIELEHVKADVF